MICACATSSLHILLTQHAAQSGKPLQAAGSELSDSMAPETSGGAGLAFGGSGRRGTRHEAISEHGRGQSMQGSHPNRWMELPDGWAVKTVYKSTLAHQQCPIAGGLAAGAGVTGPEASKSHLCSTR